MGRCDSERDAVEGLGDPHSGWSAGQFRSYDEAVRKYLLCVSTDDDYPEDTQVKASGHALRMQNAKIGEEAQRISQLQDQTKRKAELEDLVESFDDVHDFVKELINPR